MGQRRKPDRTTTGGLSTTVAEPVYQTGPVANQVVFDGRVAYGPIIKGSFAGSSLFQTTSASTSSFISNATPTSDVYLFKSFPASGGMGGADNAQVSLIMASPSTTTTLNVSAKMDNFHFGSFRSNTNCTVYYTGPIKNTTYTTEPPFTISLTGHTLTPSESQSAAISISPGVAPLEARYYTGTDVNGLNLANAFGKLRGEVNISNITTTSWATVFGFVTHQGVFPYFTNTQFNFAAPNPANT